MYALSSAAHNWRDIITFKAFRWEEQMKISVCGKGGSGKSTIVTLLANQARKKGYRVLVVDSDESNSGLFRTFGFDQPPVPLMELVGGKKRSKKN